MSGRRLRAATSKLVSRCCVSSVPCRVGGERDRWRAQAAVEGAERARGRRRRRKPCACSVSSLRLALASARPMVRRFITASIPTISLTSSRWPGEVAHELLERRWRAVGIFGQEPKELTGLRVLLRSLRVDELPRHPSSFLLASVVVSVDMTIPPIPYGIVYGIRPQVGHRS